MPDLFARLFPPRPIVLFVQEATTADPSHVIKNGNGQLLHSTPPVPATVEKTDSVGKRFFNWLSSLLQSLQSLLKGIKIVKPSTDNLRNVILTEDTIPPESDLVATSVSPPSPPPKAVTPPKAETERAPEQGIDALIEITPSQAVTKNTFINDQLTLFFQELGLQPTDNGNVAQSFRNILSPKFEKLWLQCITPINETSIPDKHESVVSDLQRIRHDFPKDWYIQRITLLKTRLDTLSEGRKYRDYKNDITNVWEALEKRHLPRAQ